MVNEFIILLSAVVIFSAGTIYIIRYDWKQYGLLYLISAVVGEIICYIFVKTGLYSFPYRLFPHVSPMPFMAILTIFPFNVLFGVRYSPVQWAWKIPFYWVLVHIGVLAEVVALMNTNLIRYDQFWDVWDSYTWWWIYLLIFEYVGGMIVPESKRKPLDPSHLSYGKLGWFILHFILIVTIFLGGVYYGRMTA